MTQDKELEKIPTIQTSAAYTAALVAQELVKYLDGKDTLRNQMLLSYGLPLETMKISYSRNPDCMIHDQELNLVTIPVQKGVTVGHALEAIEEHLGGNALLSLPDEYILSGTCHCCGKEIRIGARSRDVWDDQRWCEACRWTYPDYASRLNYPGRLAKIPRELSLASPKDILDRRLMEIGVPDNDILECAILSGGEKPVYYDVYLKTV